MSEGTVIQRRARPSMYRGSRPANGRTNKCVPRFGPPCRSIFGDASSPPAARSLNGCRPLFAPKRMSPSARERLPLVMEVKVILTL
jgi:hypothetical protein